MQPQHMEFKLKIDFFTRKPIYLLDYSMVSIKLLNMVVCQVSVYHKNRYNPIKLLKMNESIKIICEYSLNHFSLTD